MANFNEEVNNNLGLFFVSESLLIHRVGTIKEFVRAIAGWMDEYFDPNSSSYKSKARLATMLSCFRYNRVDEMDEYFDPNSSSYKSKARLATMPSCLRYNRVDEMDELVECSAPREIIIRYKDGHRSKKLAGRCFVWDVMEEPYCGLSGQELQKKSYRLSTVGNGFGVPRFDGVEEAVLITDREVVVYGGAMIVAAEMDVEKVRFDVLFGDVCVSDFDIDTAAFDQSFGLKENFQEQYDEFFGSEKSDDKYVECESEKVNEDNVWESETRARIEEAFKVIEDCLDKLACSPTRPGMGGYFDECFMHIDDLECSYYKTVARIDRENTVKK